MKAVQETKNGLHVEEIEIAITFDEVLADTCRIKGHSYKTIDYVPHFDGQCYHLLIQCTDCGLDTFEKIIKDNVVSGEYDYPTASTLERYWKKADEASYLVTKQAFATEGRA
jgi:hypothetical protein